MPGLIDAHVHTDLDGTSDETPTRQRTSEDRDYNRMYAPVSSL
jgi:imidazolonepropionase-like amidohydrolase